jgi:tetratricopeptide (TPR) repeat protein
METFLLSLILIPIAILRYFTTDHDTRADKDRKRFREGIELLAAKQYDEALNYFSLLIQKFPKSAVAYFYRGQANFCLGNYYSAVYDLSQSTMLDHTIGECYFFKGQAHYELGEYQLAFLELDKAVWHSRSLNADALRWRALSRLPLGQAEQAVQDLEKAEALGDENAAFHLKGIRAQLAHPRNVRNRGQ